MQTFYRIAAIICVSSVAFGSLAMAATVNKSHHKSADAKPEEQEKPGSMVCPDSIEVKPQDLATKMDGWHAFSDNAMAFPLDTIMIYTQKKNMVKLEPSKGTESYTEWALPDNGNEKYYIVCSYTHSSVLLRQPLESSLKTCRLSFQADAAKPGTPQVMHKMTCE